MLGGGARDASSAHLAASRLPAAGDLAFSRPSAGGDQPGIRRRGRQAGPPLAGSPAAERNPATGSQPVGARRAAIGAQARWTVDRSPVRSALHRPRGQGLFPRGCSRQQRAAARPGVHHRRHRRSLCLPRLDSRHPRPAYGAARRLFHLGQPRPPRRCGPAPPHVGAERAGEPRRPLALDRDWRHARAAGRQRAAVVRRACRVRATHRPVARTKMVRFTHPTRTTRTPTHCGSCWRTLPISSPGPGRRTPT